MTAAPKGFAYYLDPVPGFLVELSLPARHLGWLQHAVQAPQDREGKDDLAVVALLVVTAQQVSDGPDECREVCLGHPLEPYVVL